MRRRSSPRSRERVRGRKPRIENRDRLFTRREGRPATVQAVTVVRSSGKVKLRTREPVGFPLVLRRHQPQNDGGVSPAKGGGPSPGDGDRSPEAALAVLAEEIANGIHLPQLMRDEAGRFVLIKGADILGTFPNRSAALREGYRRLGVVPFLVRRIAEPEPVVYLPNVVP